LAATRKHLLTLLFTAVFTVHHYAQITAYFNVGVFNTPQNQPFVETYLTFDGSSLAAGEINNKLLNSVNVVFTAYKDTTLVKAAKYNLNSPLFSDSSASPTFIDNQRYTLPNGNYRIVLTITDKYAPQQKPLVVEKTLRIAYNTKNIQCSSIEPLESFKKTEMPGALSKSGYDLIPYSINYYPETINQLAFYFETYNTDTALGKNKAFIYTYYLENSLNMKRLTNYGDFKRQNTAKVNPLLARMDISGLGTGNYNLVIELRDENNTMHVQQKFFFQRLNKMVDIVALQKMSENKTIHAYFSNCNDPDTLRMFVECLWPIADGVDKERTINQSIKKDPELMKKFIIDFWQRRAADTADPVKLWAAYYKNVQEVMVLFKCGRQKGYFSERGRVYLQYGKPNQRAQQNAEQGAYPYEIWQYYRLTDRTNGQFFTNRKFVFVNKMLGDDCYRLIHSDVRGEIYNERWQFDVMRGNSNNATDPNALTPNGSQNNQFNDIYNNPR
jgi:GWxTD domain-containing protein